MRRRLIVDDNENFVTPPPRMILTSTPRSTPFSSPRIGIPQNSPFFAARNPPWMTPNFFQGSPGLFLGHLESPGQRVPFTPRCPRALTKNQPIPDQLVPKAAIDKSPQESPAYGVVPQLPSRENQQLLPLAASNTTSLQHLDEDHVVPILESSTPSTSSSASSNSLSPALSRSVKGNNNNNTLNRVRKKRFLVD